MTLRLNNNKTLIAAALLALSLGSAQAEGLYVGGSVGTPRFGNQVNGLGGGDADSGTGYKLYGGYALTPNFAVEGGLYSLGSSSDANGSVRVNGLFVDGVGSYEFAPQWSVLGSAGLAQGRLKTSLGNDNSPALKGGLGLQYAVNRDIAVRLQYERYHYVSAFGAKPNLGEVSLGLKVGF